MKAITPASLNLLTLPSVPLTSRKQLPSILGIYFAIDFGCEISDLFVLHDLEITS